MRANKYSLYLAWLLTVFGLVGSLFASVVFQLPICHLCWYQRVCLYPLTIILGIAAYRSDYQIYRYTLPLAVIGALFALYQYLEQLLTHFTPIGLCGLGPRCDAIHFKLWGFITLPFLSLITFLAVAILLYMSAKNK